MDSSLCDRLVQSHYLNQCWHIVYCTPRNKFQWNFNRNTTNLIQANYLKMSSVKCRPCCLGQLPGAWPQCWWFPDYGWECSLWERPNVPELTYVTGLGVMMMYGDFHWGRESTLYSIKSAILDAPNPKTSMFLVWSQVLIWEWRCSWSSADRQYSN